MASLLVNEIYLSLQGESSFSGAPCVFIRLTGCPLRCSFCDSAYAFGKGRRMPLDDIVSQAQAYRDQFDADSGFPLVELTGGEPLAQSKVLPLMETLCDQRYTVLLETSGACDIGAVDSRVHRIMDLKCPSSGELSSNRWENIPLLTAKDELKFVIGYLEDYEWARRQIRTRNLASICPIYFSWAYPLTPGQRVPSLKKVPQEFRPLSRQALAERMIADATPARFQLQAHKFIWPADQKGV